VLFSPLVKYIGGRVRSLSYKCLILLAKNDFQEFGCGARRMPLELRIREAAASAQPSPQARPGRVWVVEPGGRRLQAGIPQERVKLNRMTMKRTIEGTPKAM